MSPCTKPRASPASTTALLATLAVAACTDTTPPPPLAPIAAVAPVEKPVPVVRPPPMARPVDLRWAFSPSQALCVASATGPGASLQVQTTAARQLLVKASFSAPGRPSPRARPAKLRFAGPAGEWSLPGLWQGTAFSSTRPLDDPSVAHLLGLLGGGTVAITAGLLQVGQMRLSPAGPDGNNWIECPKSMLAPQ